ncbi:hypothetical protein AaE_012692 [Aphanomyces astaci]|uniref:Tc1-like transposase DDE domain-containing protein n=1 Tax=Aphanomyces astaci TaxID=112090 RepID=A0A6A4ZES3_APHAT|nr:hypothetical protein AaE_012692 [Aphanomyces astaci]
MENPAPQTPPKRTYKRIPLSAKNRIVDAFNNAMDWMRIAQANGVNISSAGNWLHLDSLTPKQRGGIKSQLLTEENVDMLQSWVELCIVNSTNVCSPFCALSGEGKIPTWIDETNLNLFTCRTKARSRRGTRAVVVRGGTQKGKNLHVIRAISTTHSSSAPTSVVRTSMQTPINGLRTILRAASVHNGGLNDIVVVADNAPCHSCLSAVFSEPEFQAATLLRLAPYSPMFNPIENLWSEFKAHVKTLLRERLAAFTGPPSDGQNCEEFRMQYLEFVAQDVIDVVEVNRLGRFAFCLDYFYGRVEQLADMQVGL